MYMEAISIRTAKELVKEGIAYLERSIFNLFIIYLHSACVRLDTNTTTDQTYFPFLVCTVP